MRNAYKGYKSWQYLEPNVDYAAYELCKEIGRVEPYQIALPPQQEDRMTRLNAECIILSLHEHPSIMTEDLDEFVAYERQGRESTGFYGLANSNLDCVFDNMMDGTCVISSMSGWKWDDILHDIGVRSCDIAHQDFVVKAFTVDDIREAKKKGKVAWVVCLENSGMIDREVDKIEVLYGFGVRMLGICYSESNNLGSGVRETNDGGLTVFGRECVDRMNKIGMAIDVTHSGEKTAMDTILHSKKPTFITHTGARKLWERRGLKSDELLKACADKGGVIGIGSPPNATPTWNRPVHCIESVMEHFEYVKDLVGIDHVAFGPDTMYGDHVGLYDCFLKAFSMAKNTAGAKGEQGRLEYVKGAENPTEVFDNILRWLVKNDYTDEQIKNVMGENVLRTLKDVWA